MGLDDKIKHGAEDAKGKLKETSGKATGNDKMEAEGKVDQTKADVKQAGDDVKDAFKE
ncbi:CsbD family protein [Sanguibacter suarezii]|uniref:CsbD family protein n=1 Tax=Sanguibacter suarezii TaxID=60921 RepID=UPI0008305EB8|nr:CsbD family protein [Sanguibacter suarezii]